MVDCSLCLEAINPRQAGAISTLVCAQHHQHHFHQSCMVDYLTTTPDQAYRCPICRSTQGFVGQRIVRVQVQEEILNQVQEQLDATQVQLGERQEQLEETQVALAMKTAQFELSQAEIERKEAQLGDQDIEMDIQKGKLEDTEGQLALALSKKSQAISQLKVTQLKLIEEHDRLEKINDELEKNENYSEKLKVRWRRCASAFNTCRKEKEQIQKILNKSQEDNFRLTAQMKNLFYLLKKVIEKNQDFETKLRKRKQKKELKEEKKLQKFSKIEVIVIDSDSD